MISSCCTVITFYINIIKDVLKRETLKFFHFDKRKETRGRRGWFKRKKKKKKLSVPRINYYFI